MRKYGIELEFFVKKAQTDEIVPAYTVTNSLDGNPVVGELRTGVHNNILDCVFELKKLLFLETEKIKEKGYRLALDPITKVEDEFLKNLRKDKKYISRKELTRLEELSIYFGGKTGKVLSKGIYKASLQVNMSDNESISYDSYRKITVRDQYDYEKERANKEYSQVFDYITPISLMDKKFSNEIGNTNRIKGVYAIKDSTIGIGKRVEYRSLPNNINLDDLITVLR